MKKVFLSFAVVAFMASCGGAEQAHTEDAHAEEATEEVVTEEVATEEVAPVEAAPVAEGDSAAAPVVEEHAH